MNQGNAYGRINSGKKGEKQFNPRAAEIHNERKADPYIKQNGLPSHYPELSHLNILENFNNCTSLTKIESEFKKICKEKTGRRAQDKAMPMREVIILADDNTKIEQVHELIKKIEQKTGFKALKLAWHKDEGHYLPDGSFQCNNHMHIIFESFDRETGKTIRPMYVDVDGAGIEKKFNESGEEIKTMLFGEWLQDACAETLNLKRGISKKLTGRIHLTPEQYSVAALNNDKKLDKVIDETINKLDELAEIQVNKEINKLKSQFNTQVNDEVQEKLNKYKNDMNNILNDVDKNQQEIYKILKNKEETITNKDEIIKDQLEEITQLKFNVDYFNELMKILGKDEIKIKDVMEDFKKQKELATGTGKTKQFFDDLIKQRDARIEYIKEQKRVRDLVDEKIKQNQELAKINKDNLKDEIKTKKSFFRQDTIEEIKQKQELTEEKIDFKQDNKQVTNKSIEVVQKTEPTQPLRQNRKKSGWGYDEI